MIFVPSGISLSFKSEGAVWMENLILMVLLGWLVKKRGATVNRSLMSRSTCGGCPIQFTTLCHALQGLFSTITKKYHLIAQNCPCFPFARKSRVWGGFKVLKGK